MSGPSPTWLSSTPTRWPHLPPTKIPAAPPSVSNTSSSVGNSPFGTGGAPIACPAVPSERTRGPVSADDDGTSQDRITETDRAVPGRQGTAALTTCPGKERELDPGLSGDLDDSALAGLQSSATAVFDHLLVPGLERDTDSLDPLLLVRQPGDRSGDGGGHGGKVRRANRHRVPLFRRTRAGTADPSEYAVDHSVSFSYRIIEKVGSTDGVSADFCLLSLPVS